MVKIFASPDMLAGASALVRAYGYGPLTPNTILLGDSGNPENFGEFADLIRLIYRTRRNLIMIRESTTEIRSQEDEIHVWWGGETNNIGLILTLAYQIQKSPIWNQSKLILNTIVGSDNEKTAALNRLETFIEEQRIPATAMVLIKDQPSFYDMIRKASANAGLVFMGMRPPGDNESTAEYGIYYESLLKATAGMPPLAFVLSAEPIKFQRLIGISD